MRSHSRARQDLRLKLRSTAESAAGREGEGRKGVKKDRQLGGAKNDGGKRRRSSPVVARDERRTSLVKFGIWHNQTQASGILFSLVPCPSRHPLLLTLRQPRNRFPRNRASSRALESEFRRSALPNVKCCWTRTSLYASLPLPVLYLLLLPRF